MTGEYRILFTGSRSITDKGVVWELLDKTALEAPLDKEIVLVHGACLRGGDPLADAWARLCGHRVETYPAEDFGPWPACGPIRNNHMVSLGADVCVAVIGECDSPRCRLAYAHPSHGAMQCAQAADQAEIRVVALRPGEPPDGR